MSSMARPNALLLAVCLGFAWGSAPPTAVSLGINGLQGADVDGTPFPAEGGFVLSWAVQQPQQAASPTAFEVQLVDEWSDFPAGAAGAAATGARSRRPARLGAPLSWSSGKQEGGGSSLALPANLTALLQPDASYRWRVRLWAAGAADPAPWSAEAAAFDVAPAAAAWADAAWIGGGSELRTDWALPAGASVVRARAYAAGLGAFELFLNGAKVGDHLMDAGEAVYDQKTLFAGFNVTSLLRSGASNAVGARLGNSKWGYLDIYTNRTALGDQSGDASRCFRLLLAATLSDGTEQRLVTTAAAAAAAASASGAGAWAYRHGPIVYDHLWHGEIYDSRQEAPGGAQGWASAPLASFPAGTWTSPAAAMAPAAGALFPQLMPPIRALHTFAPARVVRRSSVCSAPALGGSALEGGVVHMGCAGGQGVIEAIDFASYGTPLHTGDPDCSALAENPACASPNTLAAVRALCVNKSSCAVRADTSLFGPEDPCSGVVKHLAVRARGSADCKPAPPPAGTSVNATLLFDFGQNMAGVSTLTLDAAALRAAVAADANARGGAAPVVILRLRHTEILDDSGGAFNNYFPGMEFNRASATCSMPDWYARKWYECANQTDAYIFEAAAATDTADDDARSFTASFSYHGFRYVEVHAAQLLPDGTEAPLTGALAAAFPFSAAVEARRANSDVRPLAHVDLAQTERQQSAGADADADAGADADADADAVEAALLIEQIFNATIASHLSNLWSIPTDCPQREKRGWMGDAGISSSSLATFFDSEAFHVNFLRLIRDNQRKLCTTQPQTTINGPCHSALHNATTYFNGSVPDVVPFPTSPYGGNPGSTDWQTAYVMIARSVLLHYGARAAPALADLWESLDLFMDYLDRIADKATGLLLTGARGDWIPPEGNGKGPYPTPTAPIAAFFHTLSVSYMAEIAEAIGRTDDAARYAARFEANKRAYHKKFFNGHTGTGALGVRCCYDKGSQTSNIMALHLGLVPDDLVNATVGMLVASIRDREANKPAPLGQRPPPSPPQAVAVAVDGAAAPPAASATALPPWGSGSHMDIGIFGTTFFFEVLHAHGQDAAALDVLTETSYPSFGYMIARNATTLWEAWDGTATSIGSLGTSRNHIMFGGGVNRFIAAAVGGLTTDTRPLAARAGGAGWRRLLVAPAPAAMRLLRRGGASRLTPSGEARVAWRRSAAGAVELDIDVPAHAVAEVQLPLLDLAHAGSGSGARVAVGACEIQCSASMLTTTAGACEAVGAARCRQRESDGEHVLLMRLPVGAHRIRAQSA